MLPVSGFRGLPGAVALLALLLVPNCPAADTTTAVPEPYRPVAQALQTLLAREVKAKGLPCLSIALVHDQTLVWAAGFGHHDAAGKVPATADTVYRVGSVSKLFTDLAVMQLVESGAVDLDAPVTRYLPEFKPANPFGREITLRQLMAHRAGLVREPPTGNYFDASNPPLAATVASLNKTNLVYAPESRIKYSNAGIAVVGRVLEATQKEPFARYLQTRLLNPLGMTKSGFEPTPALTKDLAHPLMWTYHGRTFAAPTFELGMAPAGSMYSTVVDLARFLGILFADGRGPNGPLLKPETLREMLTPQFAKPGEKTGFGLGFHLTEFEGRRRIGHGGAIYGFATELAALPEEKLGVVVVAARDGAFGTTTRIADVALRLLLAAQAGKPLPAIEETRPVPAELARKLTGRWRAGDRLLELREDAGRLWMLPLHGGFRLELRAVGEELVTDDPLHFGNRLRVEGDKLRAGKLEFERVPDRKPEAPPTRWLGLIGEYGWDHNILYVLELDGRLYALIEFFFLDPLEEEGPDVFRFPADRGLYHGEKLHFTRDRNGRATQVVAANVTFPRRPLDGEDGATFRITPRRPLDALRREALTGRPPMETREFRKSDLVDLATLAPTIKLDVRYATANNFLSIPLYTSARAFLQRPAADALLRAHKKLAEQGYGLFIHDGYRPWQVTKMFWDATPDKFRHFVADPAQGSRHNRGCAVDLTLYDLKTGRPVQMVGGYDEFSDRSYAEYPGGTSAQRWHRDLLRRAMEAEGFAVYEAEWWHFDYKDWREYPILNLTFEQLGR